MVKDSTRKSAAVALMAATVPGLLVAAPSAPTPTRPALWVGIGSAMECEGRIDVAFNLQRPDTSGWWRTVLDDGTPVTVLMRFMSGRYPNGQSWEPVPAATTADGTVLGRTEGHVTVISTGLPTHDPDVVRVVRAGITSEAHIVEHCQSPDARAALRAALRSTASSSAPIAR
jgi:hypothetical protein